MRDLTKEELKLAPDWATHYTVDSYDDVIYQSENLCWWVNLESPLSHKNMDEGAVEIIKKPFDITKHEFSDPAWSINEIDVGQGYIDFYNHETCTDDGDDDTHVLDKDDAIAIAKALGVTGENLK